MSNYGPGGRTFSVDMTSTPLDIGINGNLTLLSSPNASKFHKSRLRYLSGSSTRPEQEKEKVFDRLNTQGKLKNEI